MPSITDIAQQTSASKMPRGEMLKDYLARAPITATERLVAQVEGGHISSSITTTEKLCGMETYLEQLARQAKGGDSHRGSTSSTSTL